MGDEGNVLKYFSSFHELLDEYLAVQRGDVLESREYYRRLRGELIEMLGGKCLYCGSREKLEFHHVKGNGNSSHRGGWQQIYKIKDEVTKDEVPIVVMCHGCHVDLHQRERTASETLRYGGRS